MLLVAGEFHKILSVQVGDLVNKTALRLEETVSFINETHPVFDLLLLTDSGISDDARTLISHIEELVQCLEINKIRAKIVITTLNYEIATMALPPSVEVVTFVGARIAFADYRRLEEKYALQSRATEQSEKKQESSWWKKMFSEEAKAPELHTSGISHGINRVVAVTGHRGSGVTSTVVNLAASAVREGLSVIVIDLDVICRGMNMYFGGFAETENDELKNSLIRLLARPLNYESSAYAVRPNYYMSTLPYSFKDKKLEEQFFTSEKIISMISALRHRFNLCILDLPLEIASRYNEILLHIDTFGICISNSLYSILNTARSFEAYLTGNTRELVTAKSKLIVTDYNDKASNRGEIFSPRRVCETLKMVSTDFEFICETAGYIPKSDDFDLQIETEVAAVNSNEKISEAYKKILIKILEGAI